MEPNARIWRVYLDEAEKYDSDRMVNYNDTVNMILVFVSFHSYACQPLSLGPH
jgi:hypothetical protein